MDDAEFHDKMQAAYERQNLFLLSSRPPEVTVEEWKNRARITAKLDPETYAKFYSWCKARSFSINTGLNALIADSLQDSND
mgnify:FL=1